MQSTLCESQQFERFLNEGMDANLLLHLALGYW
jgi:hypothetical protein